MIKIEAETLEEAYENASSSLKCSVTELMIEVVQHPSSGFLGIFKKRAIIVATVDREKQETNKVEAKTETKIEKTDKKPVKKSENKKTIPTPEKKEKKEKKTKEKSHTILNDTIMPESFVSGQDDYDDDLASGIDYTADYDDEFDNNEHVANDISHIALEIKEEINSLFDLTCFNIDEIDVSVHDENTILVEFRGEDAALLIGKEGYRYKALSYMIFNWINTKYDIQLRLEIAEFLKNQEESVSRYLVGVCENIEKDGRAQTKILDGVLVQIALHELRDRYPDKYVVIRSTRDGLKYIIVNDYHSN